MKRASKAAAVTYVELKDNAGQYDAMNLMNGRAVDAVYVRSPRASEQGNRLIEALPPPRLDKKVRRTAYTRGITGYDPDLSKKTVIQSLREISALHDEVRFPLPFAVDLEIDFHRAIMESYNARYFRFGGRYEATVGDDQVRQAGIVLPRKSGAVAGFSLIGQSQTGKTSAISILTERYPKLIRHHYGDGSVFYQIPYIDAECQIRASMRAVYKSIGYEIDVVCGNETGVYEKLLGNQRDSIADKEQKLRTVINSLGIGALILEEIQNMNFDSEDEKSFESFLTLCNETGVALVVVGTEDARNKMFQCRERTAHRVGPEIRSDLYCKSEMFIREVLAHLAHYQWFYPGFEMSGGAAKKILQYSHGIIGLMVRIYMYMNLQYVILASEGKRPEINADYVDRIVKRHFQGITSLLDDHDPAFLEEEFKAGVEKLDLEMKEAVDAEIERQRLEMISIADDNARLMEERELRDYLVGRVLDYHDYEEAQVNRVIDQCFAEGAFQGKTKRDSLRYLLKVLEKKAKGEAAPPDDPKIGWAAKAFEMAPEEPFSEQTTTR